MHSGRRMPHDVRILVHLAGGLMTLVAGLIIVSGLGAWLSARHRAAVPAMVLSSLAVLLFCSTPLGSGLPGAIGAIAQWTSDMGGRLAIAGSGR